MRLARSLVLFGLLGAVSCGHSAGPPVATNGASAPLPASMTPHLSLPPPQPGDQRLAFAKDEGLVRSRFVREGSASAHVLLTSSDRADKRARLLVAFPAGNTGATFFLDPGPTAIAFARDPEPVADGEGGFGIDASIEIDKPVARIGTTAVASIRALRDLVTTGRLPDPVFAAAPFPTPRGIIFRRTLLDGHHASLELQGEHGTALRLDERGGLAVQAASGAAIRLRLIALTDESPLTPLPQSELFGPGAGSDDEARHALAFLAYREKFLAGSWRFLTYFGRDTLLSTALLGQALAPAARADAVGSVLARLSSSGEVAHEEDIGEWAAWDRIRDPALSVRSPEGAVLDRKMIDDDFLLTIVLARSFSASPDAARLLLARKTAQGAKYEDLFTANVERVLDAASPFAADPRATRLVSIEPSQKVGNWRDSEDGLAGGTIPYDVNAVLVPAALDAIAELARAGLVPAEAGKRAALLATAWVKAPALFRVRIPHDVAVRAVDAYVVSQGLPPSAAVASLGPAPLGFSAVSLLADGTPVPVMHSDDAFLLFLRDPPAAKVDEACSLILNPFPAGLRTDVGIVVANPAFASPDLQRKLGPSAYHGTVVWAWQEVMLAEGLARQARRVDLPPATKGRVAAATQALSEIRLHTEANRLAELWTFAPEPGPAAGVRLVPFGQGNSDADESNTVQLWSTVLLAPDAAIRPR